MSYNGSGTFQINTSGQPVVAGTVISSTAFNALTADLATGLSTAITKDGQTTTTARIPFAAGINSSLTTDSSSTTTGSIITAGGVGIVKNLYVGANTNIAGTLGVTGVATFSAAPIYSSLTASSAVATDASKALVSVTNTGTGNNVLATSPTLVTPVLGAASATSITFDAGAVGTPSITTTGDTNTGIFFPAADTIAFAEGGAEVARFNADAQFVTAAGTASLPVITTTGDVNTGIFFPAADTIAFAEGGAEVARFDSSGNLGIGTASPNYRLDVQAATGTANISSTTGTNAAYLITGNTAGNTYFGRDSSSGGVFGTAYATVLFSQGAYPMNFYTNSAERARISSGGFFKAQGDSSYLGTGNFHEFSSAQNLPCRFDITTNASFTDAVSLTRCSRAASSAYFLYSAESNGAGSPDREFGLRGDGNGYADGTWNNNGADYAEFFESVDGSALPVGATVVLDGNKVRVATSQDALSQVMGVVRPKEPSKASMVIGNTAWNKWANKYLTDDFDRYIMEDHDVLEWVDEDGKQCSYESHNIPEGVVVPQNATRLTHDNKGNKFQHYKLNPAWDKDAEYVPREQRPEWNIIGLVGQVRILKGNAVNDRWVKMRDVSGLVEEWFIR